MGRSIRALFVAGVALSITMTLAGPAMSSAQVTRGDFTVFAAGVGNSAYDALAGRAQMVRTADGKTIVTVNVTGLAPNTSYGSHVHKAACNDGAADGHYKDDPTGPATPPNELWPAFTTNASGAGSGKDTAGWTAGPAAVSVVIHAPGGAKIACADLA